ncbi:hypothetical protein M5D96_001645 [Drosophila gunungcola]|uniref:Uncharacterized protein n=1 Tax=Drosophila gunungcola TaxID=103775 RepID=A0A9P9YZC6_9MUSC|nr:hypothetical protein M5D96_001645 [Drosophila gunungcola]
MKYCPYSNKLFEDIATNSKLINETEARNIYNSLKISQDGEEEASKSSSSNFPNISINIIDSDNICMCLCAHLSSNSLLQLDDTSRTGEAICPMCRNIIKRQPVAHRYKLLSKRLMLTQDIIINRIDTQHLSTDSEGRQYEDPYTPESTESHSPYPEVTSSCTSTSSSSRSPLEGRLALDRKSESKAGESDISPCPEVAEKPPPRGAVPPGQLKSRLENLKRLSIKDEEGNTVDEPAAAVVGPADPTGISKLPESLANLVNQALNDDSLWMEQSVVEDSSAKSRYILMKKAATIPCKEDPHEAGASLDIKGDGLDTESSMLLKETTV